MFHITHYYRNANQNNNEVAFHTGENATESLQTINAGEDGRKGNTLALMVGI